MHRKITIVGVKLVLALSKGPYTPNLARLMALRRSDDGCLALAVQQPYALVQRAAQHHLAVHLQQLLVVWAGSSALSGGLQRCDIAFAVSHKRSTPGEVRPSQPTGCRWTHCITGSANNTT